MKGITKVTRQETISLIKRITFSPRQLGCKNVLCCPCCRPFLYRLLLSQSTMSPSPDLFCFFPTFNDNGITGGLNSEPFQTIHLPVPDVFWTFCQEQGISSFQLLAASWAVTLKTYTGDNQVLFGIEDGAINEQIIRCCVDVESNHPPLMVVGEMLQKSHRLMPGDTRFGTFNSAIVTNCKPSGLLPPQVFHAVKLLVPSEKGADPDIRSLISSSDSIPLIPPHPYGSYILSLYSPRTRLSESVVLLVKQSWRSSSTRSSQLTKSICQLLMIWPC